MAKPILFDTISRSKFNNLSDEIKAKKNYQIKEEDGKISKHIAGLEGSSGGNKSIEISETIEIDGKQYLCVSAEKINQALDNNEELLFKTSIFDCSIPGNYYFGSPYMVTETGQGDEKTRFIMGQYITNSSGRGSYVLTEYSGKYVLNPQ